MIVPGSINPLLLTSAAAAGGYQIERSLRCNSSDSAYLSRTPAVAGNRRTWTWAGWVKRSAIISTRYTLFAAGISSSAETEFFFEQSISADTLRFYHYAGSYQGVCTTTAVFRDTSAWYHIVLAVDTTQATASNQCKIYVNGVQQNTTFTTDFTQNADLYINSTVSHGIGYSPTNGLHFSGYLADVYFIDGQALTPSSFTEVSATTGQLIPTAYTGSFTGNSFWLKFSDNSALTSGSNAGVGKDYSGLGNYWNTFGLSVTAGSGNDSLVDTPTSYGTDDGLGGSVRGNYCTLNPLDNSSGMTLANGNLDGSDFGGGHKGTRATIKFPASGKWYYEGTVTTLGGACCIGAATNAAANPDINATGSYYILVNSSGNVQRYQSFAIYTGFDTPTVGTILRVAYDADAQKLWLGLNGLWMNGSNGTTGNPATGANATFSSITDIYPAIDQQTSAVALNFGQRAFAYTAPTGFKALVDTNLTSTTITTSGTYTGNGVADGPFVYLNGVPTAMTIGGNAVTFGTHADKLANGFKIRTSSTTYNQNASSYNYSITSTGAAFKNARAQPNP